MFKLIRNLSIFMIFSFIGYCIVVYAIGEYGPNFLRKNFLGNKTGGYGFTTLRLQDADNLQNLDLLVLGSSHAYRSFDTRIFTEKGIRTFNLGSSAQSPIQTEMLVKTYLNRLNPQVVIYEVNPGVFEIDGVESAIDILSSSKTVNFRIIEMALRTTNIKVYNTTIFYWIQKNLIINKKEINSKLTDGLDTYIKNGGYVERQLLFNKPEEKVPRKIVLKEYQIKSFERTLEFISRSGAEVWLIRTPVTEELYGSFKNNKEVNRYFSSKGNFLILQDKLNLDDSLDFFDSHHLNQNGAGKVTKEVIKHLKNHHLLWKGI